MIPALPRVVTAAHAESNPLEWSRCAPPNSRILSIDSLNDWRRRTRNRLRDETPFLRELVRSRAARVKVRQIVLEKLIS
jgi:hypothetical protein